MVNGPRASPRGLFEKLMKNRLIFKMRPSNKKTDNGGFRILIVMKKLTLLLFLLISPLFLKADWLSDKNSRAASAGVLGETRGVLMKGGTVYSIYTTPGQILAATTYNDPTSVMSLAGSLTSLESNPSQYAAAIAAINALIAGGSNSNIQALRSQLGAELATCLQNGNYAAISAVSNWGNADLSNVAFSPHANGGQQCNLTGVSDLTMSQLNAAEINPTAGNWGLCGTILPATNISQLNLQGAAFWNTNFSQTTGLNVSALNTTDSSYGVAFSNFSGLNMNGVNVSNTRLTYANFSNCTGLTASNIIAAGTGQYQDWPNLLGVNLTGTGITKAAFTNAMISAGMNPNYMVNNWGTMTPLIDTISFSN